MMYDWNLVREKIFCHSDFLQNCYTISFIHDDRFQLDKNNELMEFLDTSDRKSLK